MSLRDRRRPQGAAQRPCGLCALGAGRARRAGLGQRAGHGGRVGSHRADPAGAEVETAFSVEGTSVGIAAGARADRRRGASGWPRRRRPVRRCTPCSTCRSSSPADEPRGGPDHSEQALPQGEPAAKCVYLIAVERGAQVPAPAARHQDGLAGAGMPEGEQPEAHSDPTGSRSCGPIISRFGRGVAPSVQRNAIARKAKRAEREDGCTRSMRIVSFMAYRSCIQGGASVSKMIRAFHTAFGRGAPSSAAQRFAPGPDVHGWMSSCRGTTALARRWRISRTGPARARWKTRRTATGGLPRAFDAARLRQSRAVGDDAGQRRRQCRRIELHGGDGRGVRVSWPAGAALKTRVSR